MLAVKRDGLTLPLAALWCWGQFTCWRGTARDSYAALSAQGSGEQPNLGERRGTCSLSLLYEKQGLFPSSPGKSALLLILLYFD